MNSFFKSLIPHIIIVAIFGLASILYFYPVLQGKQIYQSDIVQYTGMAKQQNDFRESTGTETYWTNSAFGGMPTYQLGAQYPNNFIKKIDRFLRFLPRPADYVFLYFLGFFMLMLVLKLDFRLAALGALAFGFSTYLIIILGVGHNAKAHAIAYMPWVLAGIILTFQRQYIFGFLFTALALGLEISANHFQMTYYLALLVGVLGIAYMIDAHRKQQWPHFLKSVGLLVISAVLALGLNATNLMATQEYVKESTRGQSELTINSDGTPKAESGGLSRDYITEYSYGIVESLNLFIPRFMGGGSYEDVGKNSETYDALRKMGADPVRALQETRQTPTYWGQQPIVEAPAYVGAVVIFLFILALFLVKGRLKWWLVGGTLLSLLLSFGKNFGLLTDLFIDYVPLYNKFRAVSSIQVILELCIPILAIFGLSRIINQFEQDDDKLKALKLSFGIAAGIAVVFLLGKNMFFEFDGMNDAAFAQAYGPDYIEAVKADRISLFTTDTIRSLIFVVLCAGLIWLYLKKKLTENIFLAGVGILIIIDLISVNLRYVNEDDFVVASRVEAPYQLSPANNAILQDSTHFRVFDLTSNTTQASYFHNSINGYHAAKMRRFDELFDFHIRNNNMEVLHMLNVKYLIGNDENRQQVVYDNPDANGPAWFVDEIKWVNSADEEIRALDSLNTKKTAVINQKQFGDMINYDALSNITSDSTATVKLVSYKPNELVYQTENKADGLIVFSENYYPHGWESEIDSKATDHIRVNYVLRGMEIPAGKHEVRFKFEPEVVQKGSTISLVTSILFGLLVVGGLVWQNKQK
ncbi:MAG: hypothetical protein KJO49_08790 [Bacteroidia bacterium]|nr:hypothetical protein [Bacteroidia bacterium]